MRFEFVPNGVAGVPFCGETVAEREANMRVWLAIALMLMTFVAPAGAQDEAPWQPEPWQPPRPP